MKKIYFLLLIIFTFFSSSGYSQTPTIQDCFGAIPVCLNTYNEYNGYTGTGNFNDIPALSCPTTCMSAGERNSVWYTFTVQSSGWFDFRITPWVSSDDYDWALFDLTTDNCSSLNNIASRPWLEVSCNWSADGGVTGANSLSPNTGTDCWDSSPDANNPQVWVTAGNTYYLNVSNYSGYGSGHGYQLDMTHSTASIYDNTPPSFISASTPTCNSNQLNVTFSENILCSLVGPADFTITNLGTGTVYAVSSVSGQACVLGGSYENTYTLTLAQPLPGGNYRICIAAGAIQDNCGNNNLATCFDFTVAGSNTTVTASPNPICAGTNVTLTASGATTYAWSNGLGAGNPKTVAPTTTTTYTVTGTTAGCTSTASVTVTVNNPTVNVTANPNPVCAGQPVTLTASGATTYAWSGGGTGATKVVNPASTTTYTVTGTFSGCTGSASVTVTVSPMVTPTFSTVGPYCSGASIPALPTTSNNGITGTWSPAINNTTTTTYTFTPAAGQCANTTTLTITITPLVTPTFTTVGPYCSGASIPALPTTSNNGISGTWSPAINNTATTTYTFTPTAGQCANTTTLTINITPGVAPTFAGVGPYCSGTTIPALPTTSTNGINGSWSPAINNTATTTYTFTPTAGQCANTTTLTITITPKITPTFNSVGPYCSGATIPALPTTSTNGVTGTWSPAINNSTTTTYTFTPTAGLCSNNTTLTININNNVTPLFTALGPYCAGATPGILPTTSTNGITGTWSPSVVNTSTPGSTTYTFTPTAGLCATSTSMTITVNPNPVASASSNSPICQGQTLNLNSLPAGASSYSWIGPNTFTSAIQNPNIANATTSASGIYTVTITGIGGCSSTATTSVTVNPNPIASASNNGPICSGQTLNLTSLPAGATSYSWSGPNTFTSNIQNPSISNATNAATGTYTVTITGIGGCTSTATTSVTVNLNPVASASSNSAICEGQTLNLNSLPSGFTSYSWIGPNSFTSNVQNPSIAGATTAATGTYTVTVSGTGGCTSTATTNVTVNPNPVATASNNGPLCSGQTLNLTSLPAGATSYNWSGPNSFTSAVQNPSIANTSTAATGIYTVTITGIGGCTSTATTSVTVNLNPVASASNNSPICEGQTLNLSSLPAGFSYSWSGPNSFSNTAQNPSIVNATTGATGTYTVTVTGVGGCSSTATTSVTVNPNPVVSASSNSAICEGQTLNLNSLPAGATAYSWTGPNSFASTIQDPSITPATTSATGTYTVTITGIGGCTSTATTSVTVNPNPAASASSNSPICDGQTLNISSLPAGATSYSWTGPNSFASTAQNPAVSPATTAATGTYTVTITGIGGCTSTATTSVVVNPNPIVSASNNSPICQGQTLNLNSLPAGANGYSWSGPNAFSSAVQNPTISGATTAASGNYTVTVTGTGGCTSSATTSVTVNPNPAATASNNSPICSGQTLNLSSLPAAATSYNWSGPNSFANSTQNPSITGATSTASGVYTVTVTGIGGCTTSASTNVTINPNPSPVITPNGPTSFCNGGNVALDAGGPYNSYLWSNNANTQTTTVNTTGTYNVTVTYSTGCSGTASIGVTVFPNPTVNAGPDTAIGSCSYSNYIMNPTPTGTIVTWNWSPAAGLSPTNTQNPTAHPTTATTYVVNVTDNNGCTASDNILINVRPLPTANAGANVSIGTCPSSDTTLFGVGTGAGPLSYTWSPSTGITPIPPSGQNAIAKPIVTTTYILTITDRFGCIATDNVVVTVNPLPTSEAGPNANIGACASSTTNLSGTATGTGPLTYSWSPTTGLTSPNSQNTVAKPTTTTTYQLTVRDVYGCTAADNVTVTVNPFSVEAGNNADIGECPTSTAVLSGTPNGVGPYTNILWSPANGLSTTNIASPVTAHPTQTTTYTLSMTDSFGCSASDNVTVTVHPIPNVNAGYNDSIGTCSSSIATLNGTANGSSPFTYSWAPPNGLSNTNTPNPTAKPVATTVYVFTVTDIYGCSATDNIVITVKPLPITNAGSDTTIGYCNSSVAMLNGNGTGTAPLNYIWSPTTGIQSVNSPITNAKPSSTTTYILTVNDMFGCTATDNVTVAVSTVTADAGNDIAIGTCSGSIAQINASATGDGPFIYTWTPPTGLNQANIPNPTAQPGNTTTYSLVVTDYYGCTATDAMVVSVNTFDETVLHFSMTPDQGCQPLTTTFGFTPNNQVVPNSWIWNFGDPSTSNDTSTSQNPTYTFVNVGNYIVTLTVTSIYGCTVSYSDTVKVSRKPIAAFVNHPEVGSSDNPRIEFFDQSSYANQWLWNFGDPASHLDNFATTKDAVHIFTDTGLFKVILIVSNNQGCSDTAERYIDIFQDFAFFIPNAFTPNEDDVNEIFLPQGVGCRTKGYLMLIYDRWGKQLYKNENLYKGWDGIRPNGEPYAQGVYTYLITVYEESGKKHIFKGIVTIVSPDYNH